MTSSIRGSPIYCVDNRGVRHLTPFIEGSLDELRFFRVGMMSGDCFSSPKKVFFESKKAYEEFNAHHREKLANEVGGFAIGHAWKSGWD